ncbi:MAG: GtrA family protein [Bacteroidetes bacterium]|nr:GtrA family protein [Bacteroidota bacterium]
MLSILINIGSQAILKSMLTDSYLTEIHIFWLDIAFLLQLITGTIVGFIFKFIMDKYIVFKDKDMDIKQATKQLFVYTIFAIGTTLIFWFIEIGFKLIFTFHGRDLVGGLIGLCVGYTVKYQLDKKYVFNSRKIIMSNKSITL